MKFDDPKIKKYFWWIVFGSAILRFAGVCRPLLGNFSSVQVIYAMMARNFMSYSWNPFLPRLDVLIQGDPSIRLLDFPITSYAVAILSQMSHLPIDWTGRGLSALFSIASIFLFFALIRKFWNEKMAIVSAFFFAFSPLSIIYGQSFQTDAIAGFFAIAAIERIAGSLGRTRQFMVSILCFAILLLLRIQYVFLFPVVFFVIFRETTGMSSKFLRSTAYGFLSLLPLLAWNGYIYSVVADRPDTIIMSIFHQLNTGTFISYKPWSVFFAAGALRIFFKLVLNPLGGILCVWGLFFRFASEREGIMKVWFVSILLMLIFLTKKAIDMNYYWLGLVVPASFFAAKAAITFMETKSRGVRSLAMLLFLAGSLGLSFGAAYRTPAGDRSVMDAATYVRSHTLKNDLVIASNGTNSNLLYYCERRGWDFPVVERGGEVSPYATFTLAGRPMSRAQRERLAAQRDPISALEYYRKQGAAYFICSRIVDFDASPALKQHLDSNYALLLRTPNFIVYRLAK